VFGHTITPFASASRHLSLYNVIVRQAVFNQLLKSWPHPISMWYNFPDMTYRLKTKLSMGFDLLFIVIVLIWRTGDFLYQSPEQ